ncbi:DUF2868 domain-containing protein [Marinobacter sp. SS21]|uniref:DUF2868 domain-containing protein n=1 Tax=Marinobacter sp. SS21 TaxID=2979460 RepID=UPI002330F80C|nr:DUF2868 domain-containing protein [Marinobacter sp. SS21]MDC0661011.1 DUF2868 domain-containing protein [Marinobacter sp. SS21]
MSEHPLTLLLEFDDQVRRDQHQAPAFLHRRDRKFALDARDGATGPRQWLAHLQHLSGRPPGQTDKRLARWRRISFSFAAAGALLGMLTMLGLLFYDGSGRINITVILAFILLQLLLALATTVQAFVGWRPWGWLVDRYTRRSGEIVSVLTRLHPQLLARAAHTGGLLFGLSGLATLLLLVVMQDLAFGWSTTLSTGADSYHHWMQILACPWQGLWPAAVPNAELVESTRFFRAGSPQPIAAARWGDWWPFVALTWCCYVLLPRLLLVTLAQIHLRWRTRRLLLRHPGLTALRYRMETPMLDTGSIEEATHQSPQLATPADLQPYPDSPAVIRWAGAGDPLLPEDFTATAQRQLLSAGGAASLSDDRRAIQQARGVLAHHPEPAVIVLTRAWEPPTAELEDFLTLARDQWPEATLISLLPLATDPRHRPGETQLAQWLRFAERQADPRLQVSVYELTEAVNRAAEGQL